MTVDGPRTDPYALAFGAEAIDDRLFPPIEQEAEARGFDLEDPDRFLFLSSVGRLLQAIAGASEAGADTLAPDAGEAGPDAGEALRQHGRLLYHAFHFWRAGKVFVELEEDRIRRLLDAENPASDRELVAPAVAGYLRLPRNLVWAAPEPGLRPEPADGFFWMLEPGRSLHVLAALGVRPDRPGFSVVTASGDLAREAHWADADARPGGLDFATTLPGGELDRLYSLETTAELLKLASLCFLDLDRGQ